MNIYTILGKKNKSLVGEAFVVGGGRVVWLAV